MADNWIACSERLPRKGRFVLVSHRELKRPRIACISFDRKSWLYDSYQQSYTELSTGNVTHWQPLPRKRGRT